MEPSLLLEALADGISVITIFLLRIAIPVGLTLFVGRWLERKLRPQDEEESRVRISLFNEPEVASLHCCDVKHCEGAKAATCAAARHPELPCWLALQVEGLKLREQCFTCSLYRPQTAGAWAQSH